MRKLIYALLVLVLAVVSFASCNDGETYADQKKKENAAINAYIKDSAVKVISESEFKAQDSTTDVSKNEFVLFESTGVYMQIIRKGCGKKIKSGETATVLCRFDEYNLLTDSLILSNNVLYYSSIVDKMTVTNTSGTYTGVFISGSSIMASVYSSTAVPSGWLAALPFVNIGRPSKDGDEIAKVKLIVPSPQGQASAMSSVYPCLYEITFERGR